jgi:hypothetical protein
MAAMNRRYSFVLVYILLWCFADATFGTPLRAQDTEGSLQVQCNGTLGTTQAGMTIEVKQATITGGHYFIAEDLRDISITGGTVPNGRIAFSAADGSTFDLRFKSNSSEHGEELSFENSVGLVGTRQKNGVGEKVDLEFLTMGQMEQPSGDRRYAFTTDLTDEKLEAIVRNWRIALLSGNRKAVAKYTHFPLRVNQHRRHRTIRTSEELSNQWNRIFTPKYLSRIKKDLPHDMLGESASNLVMLGAGDVYFGDKGIEILNLPD